MKIVVCYKYIRDDNEITVNADRSLNTENAAWVISPYDLNAIEAAMLLSKKCEAEVDVLTVSGEALENSKMKKAVLSRGPQKLYGIKCDACGDMYASAMLLKQGLERIGDVDLVICGEGSGDMYSQEMGCVLGALMNIPCLNAVSSLKYEEGSVVAERNNGERIESFKISGPAVISVSSDICLSHIPSLKEIMAAGKKPAEIWEEAEFSHSVSSSETVSVLAPEKIERMNKVFKASDEDGLVSFADAIRKYM